MKYDHIFDSSTQSYEENYTIDRGSDAPLTVLFVNENIILQADAQGNAVFLNINGDVLCKDKADGKGRCFSKIFCRVKDDAIDVTFPIIKLIDHYPNCDGEYDRWSEVFVDKIHIYCKFFRP